MERSIFSFQSTTERVEVTETDTGTYFVTFYQLGEKVMSVHRYRLDQAMELARAFIDADDGGLEQ